MSDDLEALCEHCGKPAHGTMPKALHDSGVLRCERCGSTEDLGTESFPWSRRYRVCAVCASGDGDVKREWGARGETTEEVENRQAYWRQRMKRIQPRPDEIGYT